jgi:hypothetical protein
VLAKGCQVGLEALLVGPPNHRPQVGQLRAALGVTLEEAVIFVGRQVEGIDVLAWRCLRDREEWDALVVEGGRDRTLEQAIQRRLAGTLGEAGSGGERLMVALRFVDVLENLADLDELGDGCALTGT